MAIVTSTPQQNTQNSISPIPLVLSPEASKELAELPDGELGKLSARLKRYFDDVCPGDKSSSEIRDLAQKALLHGKESLFQALMIRYQRSPADEVYDFKLSAEAKAYLKSSLIGELKRENMTR